MAVAGDPGGEEPPRPGPRVSPVRVCQQGPHLSLLAWSREGEHPGLLLFRSPTSADSNTPDLGQGGEVREQGLSRGDSPSQGLGDKGGGGSGLPRSYHICREAVSS